MPRAWPKGEKYSVRKGVCSQCGTRNVKVWRFPFAGSLRVNVCEPCLIRYVGPERLQRLKDIGLITINLPPENPNGQAELFGSQTERQAQ